MNEARFLTNATVVEDATILFKLDIMEVDFLYAPVSFHKFYCCYTISVNGISKFVIIVCLSVTTEKYNTNHSINF